MKTSRAVLVDTVLFDWHKEDWISVVITSGIQELFLKSFKIDGSILLGIRFKTMNGKVILPGSILKYKKNADNNLYTDNIERMKIIENFRELERRYFQTNSMILKTKYPDKPERYFLRETNFIEKKSHHPEMPILKSKQSSGRHTITRTNIPKHIKHGNEVLTRNKRQDHWEMVEDWTDNELTLPGKISNGNHTIYHYKIEPSPNFETPIDGNKEKEYEHNSIYDEKSAKRNIPDVESKTEENTTHIKEEENVPRIEKSTVENIPDVQEKKEHVPPAKKYIEENNVNKFKPSEETGRFSSILIIHTSDKYNRDEDEMENAVKNAKRTKRDTWVTNKSVSNFIAPLTYHL